MSMRARGRHSVDSERNLSAFCRVRAADAAQHGAAPASLPDLHLRSVTRPERRHRQLRP